VCVLTQGGGSGESLCPHLGWGVRRSPYVLTQGGVLLDEEVVLLERFMCRMRKRGRRVMVYRMRAASGRTTSATVSPSNLARMLNRGTCTKKNKKGGGVQKRELCQNV